VGMANTRNKSKPVENREGVNEHIKDDKLSPEVTKKSTDVKANEEGESLAVFLNGPEDLNPSNDIISKDIRITIDVQYVASSEKLREKELDLSTIVAKCELKKLENLIVNKE
jgi:hypothetical protein